MIITKCEKCGELMHKADRCFFCGNTTGFGKVESTTTIHENVKDEYEALERLVKSEKYDEAIKNDDYETLAALLKEGRECKERCDKFDEKN